MCEINQNISIIAYPIQTTSKKSYPHLIVNYLIKVDDLYDLYDLSVDYVEYQIKYFDYAENLIEKIYWKKISGLPKLFEKKIDFLVSKVSELKKINLFNRNRIMESFFDLNKQTIINIYSPQIMNESYIKKFYICGKLKSLYKSKHKIEKLFRDISKYLFGLELKFEVLIPQFDPVNKYILDETNYLNEESNLL